MFAVVITEKGGAQRRLEFDKSEVTIGRVQGNDIILPKGNVSKRHSRIVLKDNRFIVVDLKSTNGTYVNGRKITSPLVVKSGDKIYIGDFILTLDDSPAASASPGGFDPAYASPAPPPAMSGPPPMAPAPSPSMAQPPMPMPPAPVSGPPPMAPRPSAPPPPPSRSASMPAPMPPSPAAAPPPPVAPPAPAPVPSVGAPPPAPPAPAPAPVHGGAAERFPLDEEPAEERSPSPRVVGGPAPLPPAPVPAPAPPAPAPPAPAPAAPVPPAPAIGAPPSAPAPSAPAPSAPFPAPTPSAPKAPTPAPAASAPSAAPASAQPAVTAAPLPRGDQAALAAVVSHAASTFNPHDVTSPAGESSPVRATARSAVEAAIESLTSGGMSFDRKAIASAALEELVGLGALGALIADPDIQRVVVQGTDSILVDRGRGLTPHEGYFSSAEALTVITGRMARLSGGYFERSKTNHEGTLPDGLHFTAVLPPVAVGGPIIELRRIHRAAITGEALVSRGVLSSEMLDVLRRAVQARKGIAVVGTQDAGVSELVSALANLGSTGERVVAIEVIPELALPSNAVRLTAPAGTPFESAIQHGGRMQADRLIIDGVRGGEALAALTTAAARSGSLIGVHTTSGDAFGHLVTLARLGGGGASEAAIGLVASAVSVVIRVARDQNGARVESVSEVRASETGANAVELFGSDHSSTGQSPSF